MTMQQALAEHVKWQKW